MSRRIAVTINRDGTIKAETLGIKGKTCLDYVPLLEELLDAETVQSAFTADYQAVDEQLPESGEVHLPPQTEAVREQPPA
ncbi:MAG TPA: DUF2997 domain-containing protein [Acidimicrobiia bacterium]|jgi:hypothetical protein|nr:DUF2997 domain-containing protein [Acidimicrobiia bacterium]